MMSPLVLSCPVVSASTIATFKVARVLSLLSRNGAVVGAKMGAFNRLHGAQPVLGRNSNRKEGRKKKVPVNSFKGKNYV
jgi:hypothetical protein